MAAEFFVHGAGPASTLSTPAQGTAPSPNVVGATGTTTVHYKVAAIDANYGTSAASAAMTITTAPATRTGINYVGIYWQGVANAVGYLVYTDQNGGGTYVPLGYSFDCFGFTAGNVCGAIDKGAETYTWTSFGFWPTTPPAAVTNQALVTTIASGGGTLSLTLAANATNSVTNTFTLPDNSMFVASAVAAASTDGSPVASNKGSVYIPEGLWFMSTIPFPSSGTAGVRIVQQGAIELFGLPIEGTPSATPEISITGTGGIYQPDNFTFSCSNIIGYPSLGALIVVTGDLDLSHICLNTSQSDVIQAGGAVSTREVSFGENGSGILLQVDDNSFFSLFDRTNWNDGGNGNNLIPAIWFLGLTNLSHTSVFDFRDNSFIGHTIRSDIPFPSGGGPFGVFVFDGTTDVEDIYDHGFINLATNSDIQTVTFDNVISGDSMGGGQALIYSENNGPNPKSSIFIHGITSGFTQLVGSAVNVGNTTNCRVWLDESPNNGGAGAGSIGYWGNLGGNYTGCDLGMTQTGYDVQTTEVLTSGGNDANGPAGEQIIGHMFRRPQTTVTGTGVPVPLALELTTSW